MLWKKRRQAKDMSHSFSRIKIEAINLSGQNWPSKSCRNSGKKSTEFCLRSCLGVLMTFLRSVLECLGLFWEGSITPHVLLQREKKTCTWHRWPRGPRRWASWRSRPRDNLEKRGERVQNTTWSVKRQVWHYIEGEGTVNSQNVKKPKR